MRLGYSTSSGRMTPVTGYGKLARGLLQALQEAGVETVAPMQAGDAPALIIGDPQYAGEFEQPLKRAWCLTMCESDRASEEWVAAINRYFERLIVPAPTLVDVYRASGVTIPIHDVPSGVDKPDIAYVERNPQPETFTWLTYSLGDMRKGAEMALFAFKRLFGNNPRYKMVVKCRDYPHWLLGLEDEQVSLVRGKISEDEWAALMARCNAFVFPTRGEGKGMPPFEATLSGLPTVATQWLGLWDVHEWGYPVPVHTLTPVQFDSLTSNAESSRWALPSREVLDRQMMRVVNDYPAALEKARQGREYILQHYTYAKMARAVIDLMEQNS